MTGTRHEQSRKNAATRGRAAAATRSPDAGVTPAEAASAAARVLESIRLQHGLIAEFERVSSRLAEAAGQEDPSGLMALLEDRDRLIAQASEAIEATGRERSRIAAALGAPAGEHDASALLDPTTRAMLEAELASFRALVERAMAREEVHVRELAAVRDRAALAMSELAVSRRAVSGYTGATSGKGGVVGTTAPTYQDRSA
jgi:hypothetical protein